MVAAQPRGGAIRRARRAIIDTDVHDVVENERALFPYLPERWRRHLELFGTRGPTGGDRSGPAPGRPGSDPALMRERLLDGWGIDLAILIPLSEVGRNNNLELDAALAAAVNDWQVAEWLETEPRLRASIAIPYEDARLAVEEIERRAPDRRFVQVQFMGRSRAPMGSRVYWPIYQAAERHGLPICSHASGGADYPTTGAGWPSFDLEEQVATAQAMAANLTSFVFNGVFERFPKLRIVSAGNGLAWVPPLMWRLDGSWKVLRDEAPELKRLPSEYVREHVYFSIRPTEESSRADQLLKLIDHLGFDDRIVFASDYPRGGLADSPEGALPAGLPEELEHKLLYANAYALYAQRL
ncbi:MAG TPA: amidohydrolase family protein [Chloroflexota bacterium]|jgi:hypothetical protein